MARASTLGFAMAVNVLIPFAFDYFRVVFDQFADLFEFSAAESIRLGQQKRLDPKFSVFLRAFNVNVDGFFSFSAEEEKPVSMMAEDLGHGRKLVLAQGSFKNPRQLNARREGRIEPRPQRNQCANASPHRDVDSLPGSLVRSQRAANPLDLSCDILSRRKEKLGSPFGLPAGVSPGGWIRRGCRA